MPISFLQLHERLVIQARNEKQMELLRRIKKPQPNTIEKVHTSPLDSDADFITDAYMSEDGSLRTVLLKHKVPMRGYADAGTLWIPTYYKRIFHIFIRNFVKMSLWGKFMTILSFKYYYRILPEWFEYIFTLHEALLKDEHWLPPVKEIRRVLKGKLNDNVIDAIALVVEYDKIYRYCLQDVIVLYKKEKSIVWNLVNMLETLSERSILIHSKKKWKKWIPMAKVMGFIFKKELREILNNLDMEKMRLSSEDFYYGSQFDLYNYDGLFFEERKQIIKNMVKQ